MSAEPFAPGWLEKEADSTKREVATWPKWMRDPETARLRNEIKIKEIELAILRRQLLRRFK